ATADAVGELVHDRHDHLARVPRRPAARDRSRDLARGVVRAARRRHRARGPGRRGRGVPGKGPRRRLVRAGGGSLMEVQRHRLANGLRVAVVPIAGLRSVAVLLAIEAGQWFEPTGRPGVARVVAQTLLRGTATGDAGTWAAALDSIGAAARLDVGLHAATFS